MEELHRSRTWVRERVQNVEGHRNLRTTIRYLNFQITDQSQLIPKNYSNIVSSTYSTEGRVKAHGLGRWNKFKEILFVKRR